MPKPSPNRAVLLRLSAEFTRFRGELTLAIVSMAAVGAAQLYLTWLVKEWIEGPMLAPEPHLLRVILTEAAVATLLATAALFLSRYLIASVNQRVVASLRDRAIARLLAAEVGAVRQMPSGDIISRLLNDAATLSSFLSTIVRRAVREVVVATGALALMFYLEWKLALATCALVPLTGFLLVKIGRIIRRWSAVAQREIGVLGALLDEQLHGFTTIKGYDTADLEAERFALVNESFRRKVLRGELWSALLMSAVFLVTGAGALALFWRGSMHMTLLFKGNAALLAFLLYAGQTIEPLRRLSELHGMLQSALASADRVYALVDLDSRETEGTVELVDARGDVEIDNVRFAYRSGEEILSSLSISITAGEQVAIVAASGAGKSTLAALLMRFVDPLAGTVRLDGQDVRSLRLTSLRREVALVEQEPFLFSGTIAENIRYGDRAAGDAAVEDAANRAGLRPLLERLPRGSATSMSEAGHELSGGERQRISIARAIIRNPSVVILDEATSAIDSETEAAIFEVLEPWLRKRTVIAMAHRFSTVSRFPRVVVLDRGRVAGNGTSEELISSCPAFVALFRDQIAGTRRSVHDVISIQR